jgi:hypothetical protein
MERFDAESPRGVATPVICVTEWRGTSASSAELAAEEREGDTVAEEVGDAGFLAEAVAQ